jgi:uncharacterized membrane protein
VDKKMSEIILKILGISPPGKSVFQSISLIFLKPFHLFISLLIIIGIIVFTTRIYQRCIKPIPKRIKLLLTIFRILAFIILLLLIFEPVANVGFIAEKKPHFPILIDNSASMSAKYPKEEIRLNLVNAVLNDKNIDLINKLKEKYQVDVYTFSSEPRILKISEKEKITILPDNKSQSTNIGDAIRKVISELKGEIIAGILLITDGASNSGEHPISVAYDLKLNKIPIFCIGVGNPIPPKDVRILPYVLAPEEVFGNTEAIVTFDVVNVGYKGKDVNVQIVKGNKKIAEKKFTLSEDGIKQRVSISFVPDELGEHKYDIVIPPFDDEISSENNRISFPLKVTEEKINVLYVEGKPNRLFRFIRNILASQREKAIRYTIFMEGGSEGAKSEASHGLLPIEKFPTRKEDLFKYDVLILGDINPKSLTKRQYDLIEEFVDEGHGILFVADDVNEGAPASFKDIPQIERILPVSLEGAKKEGYTVKGEEGFNIEITPDGQHEIWLKVKEDKQENEKFWKEIKFTWAAIVGNVKMGAVALAVHPTQKVIGGKPLPLIVTGRYGTGKTLYLGVNEMWRTRYGIEDTFFWSKFFRSIIELLTPEKGAGEKFVILKTDKKTYTGGERVKIHATLYKMGHLKLTEPYVKARVKKENEEGYDEIVLTKEEDGIYTGGYVPLSSGRYSVWISEAKDVPEPQKEKVLFEVIMPNIELEHPEMDEKLLIDISNITQGKYFHIKNIKDFLSTVIEEVKGKAKINVEKELHDTPFAVIALVIFFSTEWYIRRKRGLA